MRPPRLPVSSWTAEQRHAHFSHELEFHRQRAAEVEAALRRAHARAAEMIALSREIVSRVRTRRERLRSDH